MAALCQGKAKKHRAEPPHGRAEESHLDAQHTQQNRQSAANPHPITHTEGNQPAPGFNDTGTRTHIPDVVWNQLDYMDQRVLLSPERYPEFLLQALKHVRTVADTLSASVGALYTTPSVSSDDACRELGNALASISHPHLRLGSTISASLPTNGQYFMSAAGLVHFTYPRYKVHVTNVAASVRISSSKTVQSLWKAAERCVVVLHGASGAGKTWSLMLNEDCIVFFVLPGDVQDLDSIRDLNDKDERNAFVQRAVIQVVRDRLKGIPLNETKKDVLLAFDEMGMHPAFVRGLCCQWSSIVRELAAESALLPKCTIRIAVAGTGTETSTLQPGSLPQTYCLATPVPDLWSALTKNDRSLANLFSQPSALARIGSSIVTNARMASIVALAFKRNVGTEQHGSDQHLMALLHYAILEFKSLNSLAGLSTEKYVHANLQAMACEFGSLNDKDLRRRLIVEYGLLEDRAFLCQASDLDKLNPDILAVVKVNNRPDEFLVLDKAHRLQRFCSTPCVAGMLTFCLMGVNNGCNDVAFETSTAKYLAYALQTAPFVCPNRQLYEFATTRNELSAGWNPPFHLLTVLHNMAARSFCGVRVRHSVPKCEPFQGADPDADPDDTTNTSFLTLHDVLAADISAPMHTIIVNAKGASFADLMAICVAENKTVFAAPSEADAARAAIVDQRIPLPVVRPPVQPMNVTAKKRKDVPKPTLLLIQCKGYLASDLTAKEVFFELFKMGCTHPLSVLAAVTTSDSDVADSNKAQWKRWLAKRFALDAWSPQVVNRTFEEDAIDEWNKKFANASPASQYIASIARKVNVHRVIVFFGPGNVPPICCVPSDATLLRCQPTSGGVPWPPLDMHPLVFASREDLCQGGHFMPPDGEFCKAATASMSSPDEEMMENASHLREGL